MPRAVHAWAHVCAYRSSCGAHRDTTCAREFFLDAQAPLHMITLQHQSYLQDQGKAEVRWWRPTREIHKLAYQARHNSIPRVREPHQYHTLLLEAAQTPQMARKAT